ncbi:MAG: carboxypeptidase-like regulatory domain-containing protein [Acidobacteriaceae bacterium]
MTTIVSPQRATSEVERTDIRGVVVDSVTGQPIARALISVNGRERYSMLTESDGGFAFERVPADNRFLQARRPGYLEKPQIFIQPETAAPYYVKAAQYVVQPNQKIKATVEVQEAK